MKRPLASMIDMADTDALHADQDECDGLVLGRELARIAGINRKAGPVSGL